MSNSDTVSSALLLYLIAEILLEVPDLGQVAAGTPVAAPEAGGQRPGGAGVGVILGGDSPSRNTDRARGGSALNTKCHVNSARELRYWTFLGFRD